MEKLPKNLFLLLIVIIVIAAVAVFIFLSQGKKELPADQVGEIAINFINENVLAEGTEATLVKVVDEGIVYKIILTIGGAEFESYATKDGKFVFPQGFKLEETESPQVGIEKRAKPDVKLFIMSYCPYGLQAQKAFLPVYDLLKEKADLGVYWVDYIMHEKIEIDENLRQYCIQKEETEKYSDYLSCFTQAGESEQCFDQVGLNTGKINNCVFETDRGFEITSFYNNKNTWIGTTCPDPPYCFPQFTIDQALNEQYGVQGSPTVVINDQIVSIDPRSPENFKNIICQAFESQPEECSQSLSSDVPMPGFGGGTGANSGGECQ